MSALSESSAKGIDVRAIEAMVAPIIWAWVNSHLDLVVFQYRGKVLIFPISVSIRVRDCKTLIAMLVGPESAVPAPPGTF